MPISNLTIMSLLSVSGGLGLMAIQLAKAITGSKIIAMDLDDEKLKATKGMDGNYL